MLFLAWTAYLWIARIDLTWTSSDEATASKVVATVVGVGLLAATGYGIAVLVRARARSFDSAEGRFFVWFAGATFVIWALAAIQLLLDGGHGAGFKIVHGGLGAISVALAFVTLRATRRDGLGSSGSSGSRGAPATAVGGTSVSPDAKVDR